MNIKNRKLMFLGVVTTLLFNIVVLSGLNPLFIGSAYSFLYLSIVPGFFLLRLLRIQGISFFESLAYAVGLSISYLFLVGISTDLLVFLPQMSRPLTMLNSLVVFDVYTTLLLLINHMREKGSFIHISFPRVTFIQFFFYMIPFFFPFLTIIGVKLLNDNNVNILILTILFSIDVYILICSIFVKHLEEFHYEIPIYLIAVSLLFMFSLRSSYIIGWDGFLEYKVFWLTESRQFWSIENYPDPYNACLSITILPTLFQYFTHIEGAFVYKFLFQCLSAFMVISVYFIARMFTSRFMSFLSAFLFMSTVGFFLELPDLSRQEIAYLFFGLLLLMLFNKQIAPLQKKILFIILSFSIVLSHYSTTYLLVGIFGFSCVCLVIHATIRKHFFHATPENFTLRPVLVMLFIAFSYIWLVIVANISDAALFAFSNTVAHIKDLDQHTANTSIIDQLFFTRNDQSPQDLLNQEISDASGKYSVLNFTFYPEETYAGYVPTVIYKDALPLRVSSEVSNILQFVGNFSVKIIKILISMGFIGVIVLFRRKVFSAEYLMLSIGFGIALTLLASIPVISLFYPIGRLDQQALFLIALPTILSLSWLLRFIPYRVRVLFVTVLLITYALFTNTFVFQLTGVMSGQGPEVFLNNSGLYYDEIYPHPSELASIHWLHANNKGHFPIFADIGSTEKMTAYNGQERPVPTEEDVFPSLIDKDGLVYANYANTVHGIGIINLRDRRMEYNFPNEFLNSNKNLIYSNYYTRVYK